MAVILVGVEHPGNLGAVARAMKNFCETELVLVEPNCAIDETARNRAVHAQEVLDNVAILSLDEVKEEFDLLIAFSAKTGTDYNLPRTFLTLRELNEKLENRSGKIGLVFGPESSGLSNEQIGVCDLFCRITTNPEYSALNLSHSVAVVLYELFGNENEVPLPSRQEIDELNNKMLEIIESLEFSTIDKKETQKILWPRLFAKASLTRRELFAAIGLLEKTKKKLL